MKKYKIGYTQGTFDMFHVGHLNLLYNARNQCDKLIVGVNSDKLVKEYKDKTPIINENERLAIVQAIQYVDEAVLCETLNKTIMWNSIHFDAIFIGNDWKGNARWSQTERDMNLKGVEVVYLPHTDGISSTILREKIDEKKNTFY